MSSSAALLDQDFGSESEDDNFNPAPAEDSDNDAAGESDADSNIKRSTSKNEQKRQTASEGHAADEDDTQKNGSSLANGKVEQADHEGDEEEEEEEEGDNCKHTLDLLNYDGS